MRTEDRAGGASCDVVVIGGGHAGIEAATAASRLGVSVVLLTMDPDRIGEMSCNPAIGGTAKGHVVREIDALGGAMARLIDATGIQFKMLNRSRGPAIWSPRAQADRAAYRRAAREFVEALPGVRIVRDTAARLVAVDGRVSGVVGASGAEYGCRAVVVCTGTFLNGLMHTGLRQTIGGRVEESSATELTDGLRALGLVPGRLKTGTPPRVDGATIDYSAMTIQRGDEPPPFFSYDPPDRAVDQVPCWLVHTTEEAHAIIRGGLDRSPLYTGVIRGVGPRYCPSIEDKVVRFADRERHQIFIEPEGHDSTEVYVNGFATSMPEDVQLAALRAIPGMGDAVVTRYGYAVEYDFFDPRQLFPSLEAKFIRGLYFAGQVNGTSGYEEAAGQGLMAGINAARAIRNEPAVILGRHEAYIGVMIDDLVTRGVDDPYRLFTSRAEHRLLLRQDNADVRLADRAFEAGMIDTSELRHRREKERRVRAVAERIAAARIRPEAVNGLLAERGTASIAEPTPAAKLLKRPEISLADLERVAALDVGGTVDERRQAEIAVKYAGYLDRQEEAVDRQRELDRRAIPDDLDYRAVTALSAEAKEKLSIVRPRTLGQAARVPGITPADVSVVAIVIEQARRRGKAAKTDRCVHPAGSARPSEGKAP